MAPTIALVLRKVSGHTAEIAEAEPAKAEYASKNPSGWLATAASKPIASAASPTNDQFSGASSMTSGRFGFEVISLAVFS